MDSLDDATLSALLRDFYGRVMEDELLAPFFEVPLRHDFEGHIARLTAFWGRVAGRDTGYFGRPMAVHMALPGLHPRHFDRWMHYWIEVTNERLPVEEAELLQRHGDRMRGAMLARWVELATT
jgi:hemoglobin